MPSDPLDIDERSSLAHRPAAVPLGQPRLKRRPRPPVARQGAPIRRIPWDEPEPARFEVDLVHHCGPEASGG